MIKYNNEYDNEIKNIVEKNPHSYVKIIKSKGFDKRYDDRSYLVKYIYDCTPLLDDNIHAFKTRIYWTLNHLQDFPVCLNDDNGKHKMVNTNVNNLKSGYPKYCNNKCQYESKHFRESIKKSIKDKYNVENAFQIDSVKTYLASRKDEIQEKRNATRKTNKKCALVDERKQLAIKMYNLHGVEAFRQFQKYDFPFISINDNEIKYEIKQLIEKQTSDKTSSHIIKSFHKSMFSCNKDGMMSPVKYWQIFKNNENLDNNKWYEFYINRFMYAESKDANFFRESGMMSPKTIRDGFTIVHKADCVSYLKPMLAKRLASRYLYDCDEIFCPFNGFSGIMLGTALGLNKKFIGIDLNRVQISESLNILNKLHELNFDLNASLIQSDMFDCSGKYESLFCCPPYEKKEQWNFDNDGNSIDKNMACDNWIDVCLDRFDCKKYLFVVDDSSTIKYSKYIVESIENRSHFGKNKEHVVLIEC